MTDTNTPAEAVAKAQQDYFYNAIEAEGVYSFRDMATAAIGAHNAWLWERAMQPDVVEAAARAICIEGLSGDRLLKALREGVSVTTQNRVQAHAALTAALTLLLGPQKEATDGR